MTEELKTGKDNQFLTFNLGKEQYGIEITQVKEIIEYSGLTKVPMTPDYFRGVINLRGNVVPVVDLLALFKEDHVIITKRTCIVIVEVRVEDESLDAGILVDSVNEVMDVGFDKIEPPPSFGTNIQAEFVRGMANIEGGFIILLNLNLFLSLDELYRAGGKEKVALTELIETSGDEQRE